MGSPVIFPLYPHFSRSYPYYIPILVGYIPFFPHHNNDCLSSCGLPQILPCFPVIFPLLYWIYHDISPLYSRDISIIFHDTPCKAHEAKDVSYEPGVQGIAYGAH